jgi:predicted NBD/HSP70 family sugar kinase
MTVASEGTPAALRARNRESLLRILLDRLGEGLTQADLSLATGLSRPSIGSLLDTFGPILTESPAGETSSRGRGRPGAVYSLDPNAAWVAAIDIGRRHIFVSVCNLQGAGGEIDMEEEPKPVFEISQSPLQTLERAVEMLNALLDRKPELDLDNLAGLVIGLPGPIADNRPRDRVLDWGGLDVADEIEDVLEASDASRWNDRGKELNIRVDNDANLSAIAEHCWGAGRGKREIVYLKWASGLGAGLIVDGALRRGAGGAAGEIGHSPVPESEREGVKDCRVCNKPCFEAAIGFERLLEERGWRYPDVQEIAADPQHPDYEALRAWMEPRSRLLGKALVPVVNALNPELIVVDGILDRDMEALFARQILRSLEDHGALSAAVSDLRVRGGRFTVSAAARGGLAMALRELVPAHLLKRS